MDTHDLENTVVAILDVEPAVVDAVTRLGAPAMTTRCSGERSAAPIWARGRGGCGGTTDDTEAVLLLVK